MAKIEPTQEPKHELGDTLPPQTTEEQNTVTAGQRRVNIMWESTQRFIAVTITSITVLALFIVAVGIRQIDDKQANALMQLVAMTLLVLGFYFSRTNHTNTGGTGKKTTEEGYDKKR